MLLLDRSFRIIPQINLLYSPLGVRKSYHHHHHHRHHHHYHRYRHHRQHHPHHHRRHHHPCIHYNVSFSSLLKRY